MNSRRRLTGAALLTSARRLPRRLDRYCKNAQPPADGAATLGAVGAPAPVAAGPGGAAGAKEDASGSAAEQAPLFDDRGRSGPPGGVSHGFGADGTGWVAEMGENGRGGSIQGRRPRL